VKHALLGIFLALAGCAQLHAPIDASSSDAAIVTDAGTDALEPQNDAGPAELIGADLCAAGFDRNAELGCQLAGPGVHTCPVQWDGAEQCDQARAEACLARLDSHTNDCGWLRSVWRADCLTACTPTAP
jgi:hypothetical protein